MSARRSRRLLLFDPVACSARWIRSAGPGMICNDLGRITLVCCSARGQAIACRGSQYTIFSCAFVAILSVEQLKDIKLAVNALPLKQKFGLGEFAAGIKPIWCRRTWESARWRVPDSGARPFCWYFFFLNENQSHFSVAS